MARLLLTYVLLITCFLLGGCYGDPWERGYIDAYKPIYNADPGLKQVSYQSPRKTINGGRLYSYGTLVLQEETDSGLHLISYQDPANPVKTGFLRIPGLKKVVIENGVLYTDSYEDLIVIPLNELPSFTHAARIPGVWTQKDFPPFNNVYFECSDPSKGAVIGWQATKIQDPKCRTGGRYQYNDNPSNAHPGGGMVVKGAHLYLADDAYLVSYSLAQPLSPIFKQRLETNTSIDSIFPFNDYVGVTMMNYRGLNLYNVADPATPVFAGQLGLSSCDKVITKDKYIYSIPNMDRNYCSVVPGVYVYELTSQQGAVPMASLTTDTAYDIALSGDYLYTGTRKGINILDISAPPVVKPFAGKTADAYSDILLVNKHLFCRSNTAIDCYDISVPASLQLISKLAY